MKTFRTIFLILISGIFLASCYPSLKTIQKKDPENIKYVASPIRYKDSTAIYRAQINAFDHYFSGLIYFKKTDSITDRIVFLSELGLTLMSIKMKDKEFEMSYCPEQLNKKLFIKQLEKDLRLLLLKYPEFSNPAYKGVAKHKNTGKLKTKAACLKFYFSEKEELLHYHPKKILGTKGIIQVNETDITISHKIPKFSIKLTEIKK